MAKLSLKRLQELDPEGALRLANEMRPQLFEQVAAMRAQHLKSARVLADQSRESYAEDARRVFLAGGDPRTLAGTKASFGKLRAACIWQTREQLRETLAKADRARKKGDELTALAIYHDELPVISERLAFLPSIAFDPASATRQEKTHQQRAKLGRLPRDWIQRLHARTKSGKYGAVVAVAALIPVRPAEIAERVHLWIEQDEAKNQVLVFEVQGAKVQARGSGIARHVNGIGQPNRVVRLAQVDLSRVAILKYLLDAVQSAGGRLVVGKGLTAGGISSAFRAASAREFSASTSPPSFYALRHAASAEIKAAEGSCAQLVAQVMGHASERSAQAYGMRSQATGGYQVKAEASIAVRLARPKKAAPSVLAGMKNPQDAPRSAFRPGGP